MSCNDLYETIASHHPLPLEQQREKVRTNKARSNAFALVGAVFGVVLLPLWLGLVIFGAINPSEELGMSVVVALILSVCAAAIPGVSAENRAQQAMTEIEPVSTEQLAAAVELARHDPRYAAVLARWTAVTGELRKKEYWVLRPAVHQGRRERAQAELDRLAGTLAPTT